MFYLYLALNSASAYNDLIKKSLDEIESYHETTDTIQLNYGKLKINFNVKSHDAEYDEEYLRGIFQNYKQVVNNYQKPECKNSHTTENTILILPQSEIKRYTNKYLMFSDYRDEYVLGYAINYSFGLENTILLCDDCDQDLDEIFVHEITHTLGYYCKNIDSSEETADFYEKIYINSKQNIRSKTGG